MTIRNFLNTQDWSRAELDAVLARAAAFKRDRFGDALKGKTIALVFFNPSLRTRTSFEIGAFQLGGHAVVLAPGKDAWPIEFEFGKVMDGDTEEHIAEVARVLSRYVDLIGVRAFPKFQDWSVDRQDAVLRGFAKHATVPVINMETITHPCQELAHILALQERFGSTDLRGKKYVLTWTYHPKPLNTAVANSALTIATRMGMDVTLLCPSPDYLLDERYLQWAAQNVAESGGALAISHDPAQAYKGADVVYAKSWGAIPYFGRWDEEKAIRDAPPPLHRRRSQDGAHERRRVQPLPPAAPQRQGDRRGDGFPELHRDRGGGESPACAEGGDGGAGGAVNREW